MFEKFVALCLPLCLIAQGSQTLEQQSMLYQAEQISKKYALDVAKAKTPPTTPRVQECLDAASTWFSIDLEKIAPEKEGSVLKTLGQEALWSALKDLGISAVRLIGLKKGGKNRTEIAIDPRWGTEKEWQELSNAARKKGIFLIGDSLGSSTGLNADFWLALKNVKDYPTLYHLIEINKEDWKLLPHIPQGQFAENIPWLSLQELHQKGYVPEQFAPYIKESSWNATDKVSGADGKLRRWIYLKENKFSPVLDWLSAPFAASRVASSDALDSIYRLGLKLICFDPISDKNAQETLALWTRKLGAFSASEIKGGICAYQDVGSDLAIDALTRPALLHALLTQDAEALKLTYRLFLDAGIQPKKLVHQLQPFDRFSCDWAELIARPKHKFPYYEERLTGEALRKRLLKQDIFTLCGEEKESIPASTWTGCCACALGFKEAEKNRQAISDLHLLLAFFYAMQPGVFSFSESDLLGALPDHSNGLHLMEPNEKALYCCLPIQMKSANSFASKLRNMIRVRKDNSLESSELIEVPQTPHPGVLLFILKQKGTGFAQLLAVNFSKDPASEKVEMPIFRNTNAVDLMTAVAESKPFESDTFLLNLPPLSGKIVLFQPKYYE